MSLKMALRLMSMYLWWYTVVLFFYLPPLVSTWLGGIFVRNGQVVNLEFEILFASLFLVWGIFLWISARRPEENKLFIDFTIWASIAHILWMIYVAFINPVDALHMGRDVIIPVVLTLVIAWRFKKINP
jgi:hypothetical protein